MDSKEYELDEYEQEIEDNLEFAKRSENADFLKEQIRVAAKAHFNRKSFMVHLTERDFAAMMTKVAACHMSLSRYIDKVLHEEAIRA